jgi:hypothetical protein
LAYLRLTRAEYQAIARCCRRHGLAERNQPTYRARLVRALAESSPELAAKVARLGRRRLNVLYGHFRYGRRPADETRLPAGFTENDLRAVVEVCVSAPYSVRFFRPYQCLLVESLRPQYPELARNLSRLSRSQFEALYQQVQALKGSA